MQRIWRVLAFAALLAPRVAGAQTTADGVAAFQRGDYQRAAEILKPIAEGRWVEEPAASFYMAMLYDGQHGLPADPVRACALYLRAAEQYNPSSKSEEAEKRFNQLFESLGTREGQECSALAGLGLGSGFQPARFELEPGYWIDIDLLGATITNARTTHRVTDPLAFDLRDARYLPFRHTELTVGRTKTSRRHFIEAFAWLPDRDAWELTWWVFEVEGETVRRISVEGDIRRAPTPESGDGVPDLRTGALLRVNERGQAEWAVKHDGGERTGLIATAAEERDRKNLEERRRELMARVDWERDYDELRPPSFTYTDQNGCGNVVLYAWSESRAEMVSITADGEVLQLSTSPRTVDIAKHPLDLRLQVQVFARGQIHFNVCTDVFTRGATGEPDPKTWKAVAGTATIQLSEAGASSTSFRYYATIQITDAVFVNEFGARIRLTGPLILRAGLPSNLFG